MKVVTKFKRRKGKQMKIISRFIKVMTTMSLMLFFVGTAMAESKYPVPQTVKDWVSQGKFMKFEGLDVFVHSSGKAPVEGHGVLVVHGYPGSSWGFTNVVPPVAKKTKIVVPDMIGFGQSDKPKEGTYKDNYSLMRQADMYEAVARAEGLKEVVLVAHDMGTSVATELMARDLQGRLDFDLQRVVLSNGSVILERATLRPIQNVLRGRFGAVTAGLANRSMFTRGFARLFAAAHPLSTHSICTLEFEDHRPLYNWFLEQLEVHHPQQIEFARLNLTYTVMSKRKLLQLVEDGHVNGWNDPRMPTISGLRRRGYTPVSIRNFCDRIGLAKRESTVDIALLEHCLREDLNQNAPRVMAVLRPLRVIIDNYPEGQVEILDAENNPEDSSMGSRQIHLP